EDGERRQAGGAVLLVRELEIDRRHARELQQGLPRALLPALRVPPRRIEAGPDRDHRVAISYRSMPELPDVELYVAALTRRVSGQPIERVRVTSPFFVRSFDPPISA